MMRPSTAAVAAAAANVQLDDDFADDDELEMGMSQIPATQPISLTNGTSDLNDGINGMAIYSAHTTPETSPSLNGGSGGVAPVRQDRLINGRAAAAAAAASQQVNGVILNGTRNSGGGSGSGESRGDFLEPLQNIYATHKTLQQGLQFGYRLDESDANEAAASLNSLIKTVPADRQTIEAFRMLKDLFDKSIQTRKNQSNRMNSNRRASGDGPEDVEMASADEDDDEYQAARPRPPPCFAEFPLPITRQARVQTLTTIHDDSLLMHFTRILDGIHEIILMDELSQPDMIPFLEWFLNIVSLALLRISSVVNTSPQPQTDSFIPPCHCWVTFMDTFLQTFQAAVYLALGESNKNDEDNECGGRRRLSSFFVANSVRLTKLVDHLNRIFVRLNNRALLTTQPLDVKFFTASQSLAQLFGSATGGGLAAENKTTASAQRVLITLTKNLNGTATITPYEYPI